MRSMKTASVTLTALFAAASIAFAQETKPSSATTASSPAPANIIQAPTSTTTAPATTSSTSTTQPNEAEMMKQMMELSKLGENHKILATMAGTWSYNVKMWMAPGAPPMMSTGTGVRKAVMGGRYFTFEVAGKMQMPGADGKLKDMEFQGMALEGYDNVKKKFIATWSDSMGTGIGLSEGSYDAATKTFTYIGDYEMMPGMKIKFREVIKVADANHHTMEYYEDRGAGEMKSMEIAYTRKK
jgi:hypothetical protein